MNTQVISRPPYLDEVLPAALRAGRIAGAVLLVARRGHVIHEQSVGFLDREAQVPMKVNAIFRFASLTKPVVAAATLALIEKGRLRLEDTTTRWLPELRFRGIGGGKRALTVRQLLTHTSGLSYRFLESTDGPYHRAKVSDGLDQPGLSFAENAARVASVPLLFEPGTAFQYSLAFDVLGEILTRAADASLPEVVEQFVTRPLGLQDTGFTVRDRTRLAVPYRDSFPHPQRMTDPESVPFGAGQVLFSPSRVLDPTSYPSGGAGMVGTAPEFLRFIEALRADTGALLSASSVDAMSRNQVGSLATPFLGAGIGFGFGVAVVNDPIAANWMGRAGTVHWGGAYGHSWWADRASELSVVLLTNTAFEGMSGALPVEVRAAIAQQG